MAGCENSIHKLKLPFCQVSTKVCLREFAKVYGKELDTSHHEKLKVWMVEDTIAEIFDRENRLFQFWRNTPPEEQKGLRRGIVRYILFVCMEFGLSRATAALGVHLFNYFQDAHSISEYQVHMVGLACLYIAVKLHETDSIPTMRHMSKTIPKKMWYKPKGFKELEFMILGYFQFDMLIPTVNDFVETYCIISIEDSDILSRELLREMNGYVDEYGRTLLALSTNDNFLANTVREQMASLASEMGTVTALLLDEEPSNEYAPSLIGAAILFITRLSNNFRRWCGFLERATRVSHVDMLACVNEYVLVNQNVRTFLRISEEKIITHDVLQSDEYVADLIFSANIYPKFVMIGGKIVEKNEVSTPLKIKNETSPNCSSGSSSSSSSGHCSKSSSNDSESWRKSCSSSSGHCSDDSTLWKSSLESTFANSNEGDGINETPMSMSTSS